ncbi:hypothetical protein NPIL_111431 [Nephila pilipes]|uniref:Uncharacterized protein n=1 Tax=Nephila pilipes TaxID=299642 RepID=A0A8X6TFD6_NEPPI|nr:hypothetical protein NPIL_111431 [Nephila pilipes]
MTNQKDHKYRVMDAISHVLRNTDVQIASQQRIGPTANFSSISLHSCSSTANQSAVLKLSVNGTWGTACVDTGDSHIIAGGNLYLLLQK